MKPYSKLPLYLNLALAAVAAATADADGSATKGDPDHGKVLYGGCMGCHSLDDNDVGPRHRGVVGRKAGSVPDYAYSQALKASGIVWDPASLDRWLTNPQKLVPGAKMFYSVPDAQSRADIIAYLATQK
jgi:cytochrome c